jgi:hypothetical protein
MQQVFTVKRYVRFVIRYCSQPCRQGDNNSAVNLMARSISVAVNLTLLQTDIINLAHISTLRQNTAMCILE